MKKNVSTKAAGASGGGVKSERNEFLLKRAKALAEDFNERFCTNISPVTIMSNALRLCRAAAKKNGSTYKKAKQPKRRSKHRGRFNGNKT